ncbi:hypothetical protein SHL15_5717 [Streptomyces hygroscopicus subsp. limoneus]|nr:hypothetical protein SHL15_5717 [Streptomyces hygroscopicus subsp. limoneus]
MSLASAALLNGPFRYHNECAGEGASERLNLVDTAKQVESRHRCAKPQVSGPFQQAPKSPRTPHDASSGRCAVSPSQGNMQVRGHFQGDRPSGDGLRASDVRHGPGRASEASVRPWPNERGSRTAPMRAPVGSTSRAPMATCSATAGHAPACCRRRSCWKAADQHERPCRFGVNRQGRECMKHRAGQPATTACQPERAPAATQGRHLWERRAAIRAASTRQEPPGGHRARGERTAELSDSSHAPAGAAPRTATRPSVRATTRTCGAWSAVDTPARLAACRPRRDSGRRVRQATTSDAASSRR